MCARSVLSPPFERVLQLPYGFQIRNGHMRPFRAHLLVTDTLTLRVDSGATVHGLDGWWYKLHVINVIWKRSLDVSGLIWKSRGLGPAKGAVIQSVSAELPRLRFCAYHLHIRRPIQIWSDLTADATLDQQICQSRCSCVHCSSPYGDSWIPLIISTTQTGSLPVSCALCCLHHPASWTHAPAPRSRS